MRTKKVVKKKKKLSQILGSLIFFGLVASVIAGVVVRNWYYNELIKPNSDISEIVDMEVPSGTSSADIGTLLFENGLIRDQNVWTVYTKLNQPNFLADSYSIPKNLTLQEVAEILKTGQEDAVVWATLPEGITLETIVSIFSKVDGFESFNMSTFEDMVNNPDFIEWSPDVAIFLDTNKPAGVSLEGFIYPETYSFVTTSTEQEVVEQMLRYLIGQVEDLDFANSKYSFYEILTLASIVEHESLNEKDRANVASVFNNRLEIGMLLQSDATVNYATGKSERRPTYADLKTDSPYNTYMYAGLPPTPISNPRFASIELSLNPPSTDYLYFIHEEDGTAHFGKNLSQHNQNVCKYLDKTC